jgi:DNA-binding SARP family transcriptional activator
LQAVPVTAAHFRISLLGAFALERDGVPIETGMWQCRVGSLLKLLATTPNFRRRRDEVIEALWPGTSPERGGCNLRTLAYRLRTALGGGHPPPVLTEQGWLALHPAYGWEIDLERFEDLAQAGLNDVSSLEAALALYRGEPLVEERYADWAIPVRERAYQMWRGVCLRLSDQYQETRALENALGVIRKVLAADPLDEEAMRGLLTTLYRAGRPAEALRRYGQFEQLLRDEIGVPPAAETMRVVQQLHARSTVLASTTQSGRSLPRTMPSGDDSFNPRGPVLTGVYVPTTSSEDDLSSTNAAQLRARSVSSFGAQNPWL